MLIDHETRVELKALIDKRQREKITKREAERSASVCPCCGTTTFPSKSNGSRYCSSECAAAWSAK